VVGGPAARGKTFAPTATPPGGGPALRSSVANLRSCADACSTPRMRPINTAEGLFPDTCPSAKTRCWRSGAKERNVSAAKESILFS